MFLNIAIIFLSQLVSAGRWYLANDRNTLSNQNLENYGKMNETISLQIVSPGDNKLNRSKYFVAQPTVEKHEQGKESEITATYRKNLLNIKQFLPIRRTFHNTKINIKAVNLELLAAKSNKDANSRFLDIFKVVSFDHIQCIANNGLDGACLHEYDCLKAGGKAMGTCADEYGACCVVQFSCDSDSNAQTGWFTNPKFPLPSFKRLSCTVTLHKLSQDVEQIRLDFLNFEIHAPTYGNCKHDQFIVSGQNVNNIVPILCGINTGQHVYIEVGNADGPVKLSVQTETAETRIFSIKVTQIKPGHKLAAPTGCLQYYKGEQGYIESMNYRDRSEITLLNVQSYLNNLNYAMCIERHTDACSITYTNAGNMQIVNYDTDGLPVIPSKQAGVEIFNCPSDWLLISAVRLCGDRLNDGSVLQDFSLNAPVTAYTNSIKVLLMNRGVRNSSIDDGVGPIVIWFRSDSVYTGRGFKLHFKQNACFDTT